MFEWNISCRQLHCIASEMLTELSNGAKSIIIIIILLLYDEILYQQRLTTVTSSKTMSMCCLQAGQPHQGHRLQIQGKTVNHVTNIRHRFLLCFGFRFTHNHRHQILDIRFLQPSCLVKLPNNKQLAGWLLSKFR